MSQPARPADAAFVARTRVQFRHCDPAGIVFYPRYFELINDFIEAWFEAGLGVSFHELHVHRGTGIPTVSVQCDFRAVSRWNDLLEQRLYVRRVGNASLQVDVEFRGEDGALRLAASLVLVTLDLASARAVPLPDDLRQAMRRHLAPVADARPGLSDAHSES